MEEEERKEEEFYLSDCIKELDRIIERSETWLKRPASGSRSDWDTEKETRRIREEELEIAREAKPSPYFGRIDFQEEGQKSINRYYFSKHSILNEKYFLIVIDWRMSVAHLFYNDPEITKSYKAPAGEIKGNITLKRSFEIVNSKLMHMFNLYRLLPPGVEVKRLRESPALTKSLERSKEFELEDIVATIQQEQHDKIAAKRDQVMIIEGVAGSGKSEVGLHRVAYLAYPGREISEKISPEKVIFLGPTRVFLGFISNLLPGLRVQKVKQTTIQEWLISILSRHIRLQQKDKLLEKYLASNMKNLENEIEVARFKNSLKMARLLDRYVKVLHNKFLSSASQIDIDYSTSISRARVQHLLKAPFEYPLNEERAHVVALIDTEISKILRLHSKEYSPATRKRVQLQFDKFWPKVNFRQVYIQILSDSNALKTVAKGLLNDEEVEILTKFGLGKTKTLTFEDLPALCYLDRLINVRPNAGFEHVVIDEAQDIPPLQFLLLYEQSRNKSFTILGDLAQCLIPQRGISNWKEVRRVFRKEKISLQPILTTYRSTYEITKYANRILKVIQLGKQKAKPYKRHGEKPVFTRSKSKSEMIEAISKNLKELNEEQKIKSIAILCKTPKEALKISESLQKQKFEIFYLVDNEIHKDIKVVVAPIHLVKGCQFDVVILASAHKNNYNNSDFHNRLLYLAVTRAAHRLYIHWYGTLASILYDPSLISRKKQKKMELTTSHHEINTKETFEYGNQGFKGLHKAERKPWLSKEDRRGRLESGDSGPCRPLQTAQVHTLR